VHVKSRNKLKRKYFSATGKEQLSLASFRIVLKIWGLEVDAHQLTQKVAEGLFHSNPTRLPFTVHYARTLSTIAHVDCAHSILKTSKEADVSIENTVFVRDPGI
jgi:hypothetical protein